MNIKVSAKKHFTNATCVLEKKIHMYIHIYVCMFSSKRFNYLGSI